MKLNLLISCSGGIIMKYHCCRISILASAGIKCPVGCTKLFLETFARARDLYGHGERDEREMKDWQCFKIEPIILRTFECLRFLSRRFCFKDSHVMPLGVNLWCSAERAITDLTSSRSDSPPRISLPNVWVGSSFKPCCCLDFVLCTSPKKESGHEINERILGQLCTTLMFHNTFLTVSGHWTFSDIDRLYQVGWRYQWDRKDGYY